MLIIIDGKGRELGAPSEALVKEIKTSPFGSAMAIPYMGAWELCTWEDAKAIHVRLIET